MPASQRAAGQWSIRAGDFPAHGESADKLTFLLGYAVLAPSGHNTQPWLFAIEGDTVALYADRKQSLRVVDPDHRELAISCGAALLNLWVALRCFGYRDDRYELLPDPSDEDLFARVRLVEGDPPSTYEEWLLPAITAAHNESRLTRRARFRMTCGGLLSTRRHEKALGSTS